MLGCREDAHVGAGLGDDHVGDAGADSRDGAGQVPEGLKGFDHHLDPGGELGDRDVMVVDQVQVYPGQEGVVVVEAPLQGLGQFRDLATEPAFGQIRQLLGVALAGD